MAELLDELAFWRQSEQQGQRKFRKNGNTFTLSLNIDLL
jgi:hypothetical protein